MSSRTARLPGKAPPSQQPGPGGGALAAGLVLGGATALILHALSGVLKGQSAAAPQFVIGGVDLSRTDLTQPFFVDFSVPSNVPLSTKHVALSRLRHAFDQLHRWQPMWLYRPDADLASGRFSLYVVPFPAAGQPASEGANQTSLHFHSPATAEVKAIDPEASYFDPSAISATG